MQGFLDAAKEKGYSTALEHQAVHNHKKRENFKNGILAILPLIAMCTYRYENILGP